MIDLIPGVAFTNDEKQLYGSIGGAILGALVGALAGALSTYIIGSHERKKQDEFSKIRQNRENLRQSTISIQAIEIAVTDLLIKCEANNEYAKDIQKGLVKRQRGKTLALMQLATPFEYPKPDISHVYKVLNDRIITLWGNLCQEVDLQNKNLSDFANFYKSLFETIHGALIEGEGTKIDMSVIESDHGSIVAAMDQQLDASIYLRKKSLNVLATIECFKAYVGSLELRDLEKNSQYRDHIQKMVTFEPSEADLKLAYKVQAKIFDPKTMFKSKSTGDTK